MFPLAARGRKPTSHTTTDKAFAPRSLTVVGSNAAYRKGLGHVVQELGAIGNVCRMAA